MAKKQPKNLFVFTYKGESKAEETQKKKPKKKDKKKK